jgi:hypothetical protein
MAPLPPYTASLRQGLCLVLMLAAALVISHPFTGVRHDGTLYAGEALARILPGEFHDDVYFLYGSQGRFTLLPALYAQLIATFGLGVGTIVGMLGALVLYLAASAYLVAWFAPQRLRALCVLSVILGWTIYGGNRVFAYSEPFLTARSFAEPAVLLGLGLLVRGRWLLAGLALLASFAIHPLIATGGILVAWIFLLQQDRRWLIPAALGALAFVALGVVGAGPFSDLFARYDDQWLALVQEANPQAFMLRWSSLDYGIIVFDAAILWFAAHLTDARGLRRLILAAAIAGLGALAVSAACVDLLLNPFFGKLQLWRAEWVMQWLAMASLPLILKSLWEKGPHARVAACFLAVGWMAPFSVAPGLLGIMAIAIYCLRARFTVSSTTTRLVLGVTLIVAVAIVGQHEVRVFKLGALLDQPIRAIIGQALATSIVLMVIALLFMRAMPRLGWFASVIALVAFAGSLGLWDQRAPWTRRLESYAPGTHIWPGLIEPNAKVYWYRDLIAPWVLLGHANYYTQQQGSGAVFSRDMIIEIDRRRKLTAMLDFQEQICRMMNNLSEKQNRCEPDAAVVRTICTEGGIDYVVLQSTLEGTKPLADYSTGVVENGYEKKFFLYRCSALGQG